MTRRTPGVYPCTCHRCSKLTATRIEYLVDRAVLTCTVCRDVVELPMSRAEAAAFVMGVDDIAKHVARRQPEIRALYSAGESLAIAPPDRLRSGR